ncbi:hypothetical protein Tco_0240754 [Tanacetum coccineum]
MGPTRPGGGRAVVGASAGANGIIVRATVVRGLTGLGPGTGSGGVVVREGRRGGAYVRRGRSGLSVRRGGPRLARVEWNPGAESGAWSPGLVRVYWVYLYVCGYGVADRGPAGAPGGALVNKLAGLRRIYEQFGGWARGAPGYRLAACRAADRLRPGGRMWRQGIGRSMRDRSGSAGVSGPRRVDLTVEAGTVWMSPGKSPGCGSREGGVVIGTVWCARLSGARPSSPPEASGCRPGGVATKVNGGPGEVASPIVAHRGTMEPEGRAPRAVLRWGLRDWLGSSCPPRGRALGPGVSDRVPNGAGAGSGPSRQIRRGSGAGVTRGPRECGGGEGGGGESGERGAFWARGSCGLGRFDYRGCGAGCGPGRVRVVDGVTLEGAWPGRGGDEAEGGQLRCRRDGAVPGGPGRRRAVVPSGWLSRLGVPGLLLTPGRERTTNGAEKCGGGGPWPEGEPQGPEGRHRAGRSGTAGGEELCPGAWPGPAGHAFLLWCQRWNAPEENGPQVVREHTVLGGLSELQALEWPLSLSSLQQPTRSWDTHAESWWKSTSRADPKKIPSKVLAVQGKSSVSQFHFNSLANITDFTLDDVFNIKTQDQSTSGSAEQGDKGTLPPSLAVTAQPVKNQEQAQKGKEKSNAEQGDKVNICKQTHDLASPLIMCDDIASPLVTKTSISQCSWSRNSDMSFTHLKGLPAGAQY